MSKSASYIQFTDFSLSPEWDGGFHQFIFNSWNNSLQRKYNSPLKIHKLIKIFQHVCILHWKQSNSRTLWANLPITCLFIQLFVYSFVCSVCSMYLKMGYFPRFAALPSASWRFWGLPMDSVAVSKENEWRSWLRIQSRNLLLALLPCWTTGGLATWHLCSQSNSASQGTFPISLSCKSSGNIFYHMPKSNEKPGAVLGYWTITYKSNFPQWFSLQVFPLSFWNSKQTLGWHRDKKGVALTAYTGK